MDTLKKIFSEQKDFQRFFYSPEDLTFKQKVDLSKEYILSASSELSEILATLPWKTHRRYDDYYFVKENLREEIIDLIKFVLNLCVIWDITPEQFVKDFFTKSNKVRLRYSNEKKYIKKS